MELNQKPLFTIMGDMSSDGYFIFETASGKFSYINQGIAQLTDLTTQQLLQNSLLILDLVHPEDREHAISCFEECLADGTPKKYEIRLMIAETEKYILCTLFPIPGENGIQLCGTIEDTTVVRHNKIHIEQINSRKNATLEVLSHDLKEPLGLMRITANAMKDDIAKTGNQKLVDSIQFITQMCERNIKLVRSIINHEFAKSAIIEIKKERVDIVWEIHDVIRTYRKSHLRELKDFRFQSSADKIYLFLDTMKMMQVVNNLISNAIKFTTLHGIIDIRVTEHPDTVVLSVADNGIGIPKHQQEHLFETDKQTFNSGLAGEGSGGLGMSIIKSIVDLHHGKVWVESTEGVGTIFFIALPK